MFENIVTKEEVKFNELEKKIYKLVCNFGCAVLRRMLENYDKKIMKVRDTKKYRHKGYRKNCIKTVMGEIEYTRAIYLVEENGESRYVFLLDEQFKIDTIGKISVNLAEKIVNTVPNTTSYRKAAQEIEDTTNETISHEGVRDIVLKLGEKQTQKEQEEVRLMKEGKLVKGTKQLPALFEEADGIWLNLQGKDRQKQQEKYRKKCEKQGKEYKKLKSVKTELKLHVTYEGWKKDDKRHPLVNKTYITGMMSSKELEKRRNAKIFSEYDEEKIELRVLNGDGARWINNIKAKGSISQKDNFHIHQEIVRDIQDKTYREELITIIKEKRYKEVAGYIEHLKYELGGEEKVVKKLNKLQSYLKEGLPRYQEILEEQNKEIPKAPEGIEYRNPGIMESQIFTVLSVRLTSGRKSFSKTGATALAKICAMKIENDGKIEIEKIEEPIKIDNAVEEWINEIENNVNKMKKMHRVNRIETEEYNYARATIERTTELENILEYKEITELMYR